MTVQTGFAFPARDFTGLVTSEGVGGESLGWKQPGVFYQSVGFVLQQVKFSSLSPMPGQLAATPDLARWTPVVMGFTAPAGSLVVVVAQIGTDSGLWMVVYDERIRGTAQPWAPLFVDKSKATVVGGLGTDRQFTLSVLPNGGWQRPNVTLVPYVAGEVTL